MGNSPCCRESEVQTAPEAGSKHSDPNHQIIGVMNDSFRNESNRNEINRSSSVLSNDEEIAQAISLRTVSLLLSSDRADLLSTILFSSKQVQICDLLELNPQDKREDLGLQTNFSQTLIADSEAAPTFQPKNKMEEAIKLQRRTTQKSMTFGKSALHEDLTEGDDFSNYASNQSRADASIKTIPTEVQMRSTIQQESVAELSTDLEQTEDGVIKVEEP